MKAWCFFLIALSACRRGEQAHAKVIREQENPGPPIYRLPEPSIPSRGDRSQKRCGGDQYGVSAFSRLCGPFHPHYLLAVNVLVDHTGLFLPSRMPPDCAVSGRNETRLGTTQPHPVIRNDIRVLAQAQHANYPLRGNRTTHASQATDLLLQVSDGDIPSCSRLLPPFLRHQPPAPTILMQPLPL